MGKFNHIQNSFTSGEVSDKFKGRTELQEYKEGLEQLENFIVQKKGGAVKRPGSRFVSDIEQIPPSTTTTDVRSIPFIFAKTEAYVITIGEDSVGGFDFIRIFKNDGTLASLSPLPLKLPILPLSITSIDIYGWNYAQSGDVLILTHSSGTVRPLVITRTGEDEFFAISLLVSATNTLPAASEWLREPFLAANTDPDKKLNPSATAVGAITLGAEDNAAAVIDFFDVGHDGAYFRLTHGASEGVLRIEFPAGFVDHIWDAVSTATETFTIASGTTTRQTGDRVKLTLNSGTFPAPLNDVDDFFVIRVSATEIRLATTLANAIAGTPIDITTSPAFNMTTNGKKFVLVDARVIIALGAATATDNWNEGAWSSFQGFPKVCAFYEQRLFLGGTTLRPDSIFGSITGNIFHFAQVPLDQDNATDVSGSGFFGAVTVSSAFDFTIASLQANVIQWMSSQAVLQVGTVGSEYVISGGDSALSSSSIQVKQQTNHGGTDVQAIQRGVSTVFITRNGRELRDFRFNRDNASYVSTNLSITSDHIVFSGFDGAAASLFKGVSFLDMVYQPSRETIWLLTSNKQLISVTVSSESEVIAWAYHPFKTGTDITGVTVIPNLDASFDDVYIVAKRTIDSRTVFYLEKIGDDFEHDVLATTSTEESDIPFYSDSSVKIVLGSSTDTVTLPTNVFTLFTPTESHLEGETVKVLAEGVVDSDKTVASGQITLDAVHPSGSVIILGLTYKSKFLTLDIDAGAQFGSSQGNRQRIDRVAIRLYKSQKGKYRNQNATALFPIEYADDEVFTGIRRLNFEITPDMDNQLLIEHDDPVPFNIISLTYRGVSYD